MTVWDHPYCTVPEDDRKVWRYMDFTQFLSLIENGLHLTRADEFEDDYEGTLPSQMRNLRGGIRSEYPDEWVNELLPKFRRVLTKFTHLSCWHLNASESAAMWDLYLDMKDGLCIQTTVEKLRRELDRHVEEQFYLSEVDYIDYSEDSFRDWEPPLGNTVSPFIHKRKSFEHENELRVIRHKLPFEEESGSWIVTAENLRDLELEPEQLPDPHIYAPVDLSRLVESVYVAPHAGGWIANLLEDVRDSYELDFDIESSNMNSQPEF